MSSLKINKTPLSRKALKVEVWNMLPDSAKKEMNNIKKSYIESMMADIDSYCSNEKIILKYIDKMCMQSLSPEVFEKWESVKNNLLKVRKNLK